jgi:hypothetical protein
MGAGTEAGPLSGDPSQNRQNTKEKLTEEREEIFSHKGNFLQFVLQ